MGKLNLYIYKSSLTVSLKPIFNFIKPLILPLTTENMLYPEILPESLTCGLHGDTDWAVKTRFESLLFYLLWGCEKFKAMFSSLPSFHCTKFCFLVSLLPFQKTHSQKRIWKVFRQCRPLVILPFLESSFLRFCWANCLGAPVEHVLSMGNLLPTPGFHSCLDAVDAPVSRPVFSCELRTLASNSLPGITIYASGANLKSTLSKPAPQQRSLCEAHSVTRPLCSPCCWQEGNFLFRYLWLCLSWP